MVAFAITAVSAFLTASGFLIPPLWFLGVLGFVPYLYVLRISSGSPRFFLATGWVFGGVYAATASACMFWSTLPLDWLDVSSPLVSVLLVAVTWSTLAVLVGSPVALFAYLFAGSRLPALTAAFYGASLWTLCQYLQSWSYALVTAGNGSIFEPHISSLSVGYSLASFSPFLFLAPFGGVYLLNFTAVFLALLCCTVLFSLSFKMRALAASLILLVAAIATVADRANMFVFEEGQGENTIRVALVTTYFSSAAHSDEELRERSFTQIELAKEWAKTHEAPDIIVFPEAAQVLKHSGVSASEFLSGTFGTNTALIDSGTADVPQGRTVQMQFYDAEGELKGLYDKVFLVGFGEYMPWLYTPFISLMSSDKMSAALGMRAMVRGNEPRVVEMAGARIGGLFCMEVMSPLLYRTLAQGGAQILVNASSQSFFHESSLMDTYTLLIAKVRAAENDRYLLIAGNGMRSTVISDRGRIVARSTPEAPVLSMEVPLKDSQTPYVRLGEGVLIIPLLIVVVCMFAERRRMA